MVADTASPARLRSRLVRDVTGAGDSERRIMRQFALFIGVGYLIYVGVCTPLIPLSFDASAAWWAWGAPIAVFGTGVAVGIAGLLDRTQLVATTVLIAVATYLVAGLTWPAAWNGGSIENGYGLWLTVFNGLPAMASTMALTPLGTGIYTVAVCAVNVVCNTLSRRGDYANPLLADLAFNVGFVGLITVAAMVGVRTARLVDSTRAVTIDTARRAAAASATEIERARFAALTHDGVMATLLGAARQGSTEATRQQAAATLTEFDALADPVSSTELTSAVTSAQIRSAVAQVDSTIAVEVTTGDPEAHYPTDVVRQVVAAAAEAVRNIVRHADPGPGRRVRMSTATDGIAVDVVDDGPGFDPMRVPVDRLGIAVSIRGRMADIDGGSATVDSSPGAGTAVAIRWERP
ncbi:MAG: ATP-binding protein [Gordonia paraffinivorans]